MKRMCSLIKTKNNEWMTAAVLSVCLASVAVLMGGCSTASVADEAPRVLDWPIELVSEGHRFTEGVAVSPEGEVYFSDIPDAEMHIYSPRTGETRVFQPASGGTNGQLFVPAAKQGDVGGQLLVCEAKVTREVAVYRDYSDAGSRVVLATGYEGKKFNSPNDVTLWGSKVVFTDPCYGDRSHMELDDESVYIIDPSDKSVTRLNHTFVRPNGIVTSNDGKIVYIADHGACTLLAWDTTTPADNPSVSLFAVIDVETGGMDGMCVDAVGNIYTTLPQMKLVSVISPEGKEIGRLEFEEGPTNCTLTSDGKMLCVTAQKSLYMVRIGDL